MGGGQGLVVCSVVDEDHEDHDGKHDQQQSKESPLVQQQPVNF